MKEIEDELNDMEMKFMKQMAELDERKKNGESAAKILGERRKLIEETNTNKKNR